MMLDGSTFAKNMFQQINTSHRLPSHKMTSFLTFSKSLEVQFFRKTFATETMSWSVGLGKTDREESGSQRAERKERARQGSHSSC